MPFLPFGPFINAPLDQQTIHSSQSPDSLFIVTLTANTITLWSAVIKKSIHQLSTHVRSKQSIESNGNNRCSLWHQSVDCKQFLVLTDSGRLLFFALNRSDRHDEMAVGYLLEKPTGWSIVATGSIDMKFIPDW